jgi:hypothetical protein
MTSAAVSRPRTISSSFITFAGLKKWWPSTCSGRPLARASSSMSSVDELDARMQPAGVAFASSAKVLLLSSRSSNTASTTMSADSKPAYVVDGEIRATAASACAAVILPFSIVAW